MKLSFKNFEAIVETNSSISATAAIKVNFKTNIKNPNEFPYQFDRGNLLTECKIIFEECLKIGEKEVYTTEEQATINEFFILTGAISILDPYSSSRMRAIYSMANAIDPKHFEIINLYDRHALGFDNVIKRLAMIEMITTETKTISVTCEALTQKEIKAFVSFLRKNSFETLRLAIAVPCVDATETKAV